MCEPIGRPAVAINFASTGTSLIVDSPICLAPALVIMLPIIGINVYSCIL